MNSGWSLGRHETSTSVVTWLTIAALSFTAGVNVVTSKTDPVVATAVVPRAQVEAEEEAAAATAEGAAAVPAEAAPAGGDKKEEKKDDKKEDKKK